jgi:hypothetical protein
MSSRAARSAVISSANPQLAATANKRRKKTVVILERFFIVLSLSVQA